jgi:hypothetical protein
MHAYQVPSRFDPIAKKKAARAGKLAEKASESGNAS